MLKEKIADILSHHNLDDISLYEISEAIEQYPHFNTLYKWYIQKSLAEKKPLTAGRLQTALLHINDVVYLRHLLRNGGREENSTSAAATTFVETFLPEKETTETIVAEPVKEVAEMSMDEIVIENEKKIALEVADDIAFIQKHAPEEIVPNFVDEEAETSVEEDMQRLRDEVHTQDLSAYKSLIEKRIKEIEEQKEKAMEELEGQNPLENWQHTNEEENADATSDDLLQTIKNKWQEMNKVEDETEVPNFTTDNESSRVGSLLSKEIGDFMESDIVETSAANDATAEEIGQDDDLLENLKSKIDAYKSGKTVDLPPIEPPKPTADQETIDAIKDLVESENEETKKPKRKPRASKKVAEQKDGLDDFVTETLAEVYEKQGLYDKAVEVYEQLMHKFPKKSAYFAEKIENLKK
ncbi:MAG: hypothetical protein R2798_07110 [Chitinophagales bacterium]|nr:hypothetical protein [Bacteroidota bacterium]